MCKRLVAVAVLLLAVTACGGESKTTTTVTSPPPKLKVVTTTPVLADFATVIGGDHVDVQSLVDAGVNPHTFAPDASDIAALSGAQLVIRNGAGLDKWLEPALKSAATKVPVVDASTCIQVRGNDPHIWHSQQNAKLMVDTVRRSLGSVDAAHDGDYATNQRAYSAQLDGLERETRQSLEAIKSKKLVTAHQSLSYYAAEFGLQYVASVGGGPDAPVAPTAEQIAQLAATVKTEGVKAVFAESSLDPADAEAVASAAGVKLVKGPDALLGDTLATSGNEGDSYIEAIGHNTAVIVQNLS